MADIIEKPKNRARAWVSFFTAAAIAAFGANRLSRPTPPVTDAIIRQTIQAGAAPAEIEKLVRKENVQKAKDAVQEAIANVERRREEIKAQEVAKEEERQKAADAISARKISNVFNASVFKRGLDSLKEFSEGKLEYTAEPTGGDISLVTITINVPSFHGTCDVSSMMTALFFSDGDATSGITLCRADSFRDEGQLTALKALKKITTALKARGVCPFKPQFQVPEAAMIAPLR